MAAVAEAPPDPLAAVIDTYLSTTHRDNLGTSCAVTTLAGDVARSNPRARAAYTNQVGVYIDMLVGLLPPGTGDRRRATAITALSTLVGAVSMARAVNDEALSQEILASAASELKAQLR
jgi:TetR/AcrR family transcriptional repressor of nem operon